MAEIKQIGNLFPSKTRKNPNQGRVYDTSGIAPVITCMGGGNLQPFIVIDDNPQIEHAVIIDDLYEKRPTRYYEEVAPTLRSERTGLKVFYNENQQEEFIVNCGDEGQKVLVAEMMRNEYAVAAAIRGRYNKNGNIEQKMEISDRGYANALTTVQKDSLVAENKVEEKEPTKVHLKNGETISSAELKKGLRVRKLTPRECWRLMNCTDEDFDKAASVISNSRLYACAGNAIVVNVLVAILGQLFDGKEEIYKEINND